MGRLLIGNKEKYGLKEDTREIILNNGMCVTVDYRYDKPTLCLAVMMAAMKREVTYKEMYQVVVDSTDNHIKDDLLKGNELITIQEKNFRKTVDDFLRTQGIDPNNATEMDVEHVLRLMEDVCRNDIRLMLFRMHQKSLIKRMVDYYNMQTEQKLFQTTEIVY